jgi:predicted transcriptional regulator
MQSAAIIITLMPRPREDRKAARVSVSLDPQTYARLFALASRNDVSASWMVRRAITELIERTNEPAENIPQGHSKDARVSVSLAPGTYTQLLALASRNDVPTSWMVSRAVRELIERTDENHGLSLPRRSAPPRPEP